MCKTDYNGYLYEKAFAVMTSIIVSTAKPVIKLKDNQINQLDNFISDAKKKLREAENSSFCKEFSLDSDTCYSISTFIETYESIVAEGFIIDDNDKASAVINSLLKYLLWLNCSYKA